MALHETACAADFDHASLTSALEALSAENINISKLKAASAPPFGVELTGYYEPEFRGALSRHGVYQHPVFALQLHDERTRAEILAASDGTALAWLADPLDAYLLQVQGSGRIMLPDGKSLRLGYAGKNTHPYVSIGKILIERGAVPAAEMSLGAIRAWCADHPDDVETLLNENPSFVFFKPLDLDPNLGPLGAAGLPLTPLISVAVDPTQVPLGSLAWLETPNHCGFVVAQDIGGAIKGNRIDLFCGTGLQAEKQAGALHEQGVLINLGAP